MTIIRPSLLAVFLTLLGTSAAFTSFPISKAVRRSHASTWIGMSTEGEGEPPAEETAPPAEEPAAAAGNDILSSPEFLKRKLEVLKTDLETAEKDLATEQARYEEGKAEWGEQLEDLQKEYKNIQERMNTQSNKGDAAGTIDVARKMMEALDNFDRAFGAVEAETDEHRAIEAEYKIAYDMVIDTFKKLGVEQVETVGTEFNYEFHQAVMQQPTDEYEDGIVCEELAKGFRYGDVLIRAAMVVVAA